MIPHLHSSRRHAWRGVLLAGSLAASLAAHAQVDPDLPLSPTEFTVDTVLTGDWQSLTGARLMPGVTLTNQGRMINGIVGLPPIAGSAPAVFLNLGGLLRNEDRFENWGAFIDGVLDAANTEDGFIPLQTRGGVISTGRFVNGGVHLNTGTFENRGEYVNLGRLMPSPLARFDSAGTLRNWGEIGSQTSDALSPVTLHNSGLFVNGGDAVVALSNTGSVRVTTGGRLRVDPAALVTVDGLATLADGQWRVIAGPGAASLAFGTQGGGAALRSIGSGALLALSGTGARVDNLGTLERVDGRLSLLNGAAWQVIDNESRRLAVGGRVDVGSRSALIVGGRQTLQVDRGATVQVGGSLVLMARDQPGSIAMTVDGRLGVRGLLDSAGGVTIGGAAGAAVAPARVIVDGRYRNRAAGSLGFGETGELRIRGQLDNDGTLTMNRIASPFVRFTNDGVVQQRGTAVLGDMAGIGTWRQAAGETSFLGQGVWAQARTEVTGGRFVGQGRVTGALVNDAQVTGLGSGLALAGPVTGTGAWGGTVVFEDTFTPGEGVALVTGDALTWAGGARLVMDAGTTAGTAAHDVIEAQALTLGGTLELRWLPTADAAAEGDRFDLMRADVIAGSFAALSLPVLAEGLTWQAGVVATDAGQWIYRAEVRALAMPLMGVTPVPEPASVVMMSLGLAALGVVRRRQLNAAAGAG